MSDVKEVGIIGQKYEDRNTGKTGILDSRDDKCKTLMMVDDGGKGFSISYSSFRSRWRKCIESSETPNVTAYVEAEVNEDVVDEKSQADEDKQDSSNSSDKYEITMSPDKTSCTIWCSDDRTKHCIFILNSTEFYVTMPKSMLEIVDFNKFNPTMSFDDGFAVEYVFTPDELKDVYNEVINSIEAR